MAKEGNVDQWEKRAGWQTMKTRGERKESSKGADERMANKEGDDRED